MHGTNRGWGLLFTQMTVIATAGGASTAGLKHSSERLEGCDKNAVTVGEFD
jgi:hypothetical protein